MLKHPEIPQEGLQTSCTGPGVTKNPLTSHSLIRLLLHSLSKYFGQLREGDEIEVCSCMDRSKMMTTVHDTFP